MPKLNLEAKDETQKIIKEYLEEHVSVTLAEKINNGVLIQKEGKTYVDDDGVMHYAEDEALPYDPTAFDVEALCKLDELFGNEIEMR